MPENLFDFPSELPEELTQTLLQAGGVRIERIVSTGQSSPAGFWYDQTEHEWVVVLSGSARLEFEDEIQELAPGDYVNIPAGVKHRVAATSKHEPTVWLAVFYSD
ncbi:MAG: cupin domain-containing protein [bacterium]|nr:cupin domain-containing protein [bacterium]